MAQPGINSIIWSNNLRSVMLLFAFPTLLLAMLWAFFYMASVVSIDPQNRYYVDHAAAAFGQTIEHSPYIFAGVTLWFMVAWIFYQRIIDKATGAHDADPNNPDHKRAYRLLESLCLSRGVSPVPHLKIIDSRVLNAYASGLSAKSFTVTLTSGLMRNLNDEELEGVIAHELAHILNRDVRLLIVSIIFVGLLGFLADFARIFLRSLSGSRSSNTPSNNQGGGQSAAVLVIIAFFVLIIGWGFSQLLRFSLSRSREYLADAGAVEMTHNPAALARALRIISHRAKLDTPEAMQAMMIENPTKHLMGMFSTHPPIERRIALLNSWAKAERP